jgi:hypothetical protein
MSSPDAHWTVLVAHPETPRAAVAGIAVEARLATAATLVCSYSLHGDLARVRLTDGRAGHRADGLWEHTCFEAFIGTPGERGYYEFNFSPTLAWAAYEFTGYRAGMAPATLSEAPGLHVHRSAGRLQLTATVHLRGLTLCESPVLRLAMAAVIEDERGALSYWALEHPPGRPDFHRPENFTIELRSS